MKNLSKKMFTIKKHLIPQNCTKQFYHVGFTLAEVLITLGIIGIVVAITIPSLVGHYKKIAWVNQLKKSMSTVENGFKTAMAEDGVDNIGDTTLFKSLNGYSSAGVEIPTEFDQNLRKYFRIAKSTTSICKGNDYDCKFYGKTLETQTTSNTQSARAYYLADGTILGLTISSDGLVRSDKIENLANWTKSNKLPYLAYGYVFLDVNGKKAPNTFGRDVFAFMLASNGKLYAGGTKEYGCLIEAAVYGNCWADRYTWDGTQYPNNGCLYLNQGKNVSGFGCAGRIIADGWKMDY